MSALKDGVPFSGGTGRGNWIRATPRRRCPVCGGDSWCSLARNGTVAMCMRVAAGREHRNRIGESYWIHSLDGSSTFEAPPALPSETRERCSDDECDRFYRLLLAKLRLDDNDRKALRRRGLDDTDIERGLYRTLPVVGRQSIARELISAGADTSLPGLVVKNNVPTLAGMAGLVIPVFDAQERIVALRIRPTSGESKYQWLSGASNGGAGSGVHVHIPPINTLDTSTVRVTEGELKATIATKLTNVLTISIPGVSMWNLALAPLQALGASRVLVAYDADARTKPEVARALRGFLAELQRRGIEHAVETWDQKYKGIDDALFNGADITATEQSRKPSKSEQRVRERLPTPAQRVAVNVARDAIREALASAVPSDRVLARVSPGTGKSYAAVDEIASRVARGERCAYLARDYKALNEIESALSERGVLYRKARGILQRDDCKFPAVVERLQRMGCSPRQVLCNGALDNKACEHREGCASASAFEGSDDALVSIGVYAMAPLILKSEPVFVVVDESPELREKASLTREQLLAATQTADVKGNEIKAALAVVASELAFKLGSEPIDAATLSVWNTLFPSSSIDRAFSDACKLLAESEEPLSPSTTTLDRLRKNYAGDVERWATFRTLRSWARDGVGLEISDGTLHLAWRSEPARSIANAAGAVVVLDGTGSESEWRRAVGETLQVVAHTTEERSKVRRTIIARRGTKRAWLANSVPNLKSSELRGAVHQFVRWTTDNVPRGSKVVVATHRALCQAFEQAWIERSGEAVELLEPLRGYALHFTYFGSCETRGVNLFAEFDASVSLGDPRPNAGEKRVAGESADEHACAALGQFHDRLRGVNRENATLWSLHVGELVPAGQWDTENTTVTSSNAGRPHRLVDARSHARTLLDQFGSVRAVAEATGLHRSTVEASLDREVSETVAKCYVVHLAPRRKRKEEGTIEKVVLDAELTVPPTQHLDTTSESLGATSPTYSSTLVPMNPPVSLTKPLAPWERVAGPTIDESTRDGPIPQEAGSNEYRGAQGPS
jgi:hypothetical protein